MPRTAMASIAALLALTVPAGAQSVEEFYRGKTVNILVGFTAGGGYDLYARVLGRHLGRHIPGNPQVVVQNMPGAGSLKATQYVYGVAPKDGTTLATVSRGMATDPLLGDAKFDATKIHLGRQRHQRDQHLRHLAKLADQELGRHVPARVHARRQRHRRRPGHLRADPPQRVRRQGQARHRLSGRQRHQPCDGARRGRRPLRLVVVEPQEPEGLAAARSICWRSSRWRRTPISRRCHGRSIARRTTSSGRCCGF